MTLPSQAQKDQAEAWFAELRDKICAAFEQLEDELTGDNAERFAELPPGRFARKAWRAARPPPRRRDPDRLLTPPPNSCLPPKLWRL